jgi:hypothetical protein
MIYGASAVFVSPDLSLMQAVIATANAAVLCPVRPTLCTFALLLLHRRPVRP